MRLMSPSAVCLQGSSLAAWMPGACPRRVSVCREFPGKKDTADYFPLHKTFPSFVSRGITLLNSMSLTFPSQSSLLIPPLISGVYTSEGPKDQFLHCCLLPLHS